MPFYAHPGHPLEEHLLAVAELARGFASEFDSGDWAFLAGLWHDLGKCQPEFQRRLAGDRIAVEHSGVGATLAVKRSGHPLHPVAFLIAGHHAGLANPVESLPGGLKPLVERVRKNHAVLDRLLASIPSAILDRSLPPLPAFLVGRVSSNRPAAEDAKRRIELWIRLLFSALTDADYLDTEGFLEPERVKRRAGFPSLTDLLPLIDAEIVHKVTSLSEEQRRLPINRARALVADACRRAESLPSGFFSLTAPTGAGKTLSSMRFSLGHGVQHALRRVIVVLPYTSIIEQNAAVYRRVFGARAVVEHHANLDPKVLGERAGEENTERHQLACENWDAPVIVTTTVQLFESLFSNRPSRCRKLHNVARSVVVLDEVQSLPPGLLLPILDVLNELAANYGCSIVLSTATPPALVKRPGFEAGLVNVREIVPDPSALAQELRRVRYHWPTHEESAVSWDTLTREICSHPKALAVVHRRADARQLATLVRESRPADPVFHLSALMCSAHRSDVLTRVREVLATDRPCRLISTQLIEAGVDIDFPVLFRALAGLDSVVQAAGRCNREGRSAVGEVHVFRAASLPPRGVLRRGYEIMNTMLAGPDLGLDPSDPDLCHEYFRQFYFANSLDAHGIQAARAQLNFATVARDFKVIEDDCTTEVIVPYADAEGRIGDARRFAAKENLRALQPYAVRVYPQAFQNLREAGAVEEVCEGVHAITVPFRHLYDDDFGLILDDHPAPDASSLVI